MERLLVQLHEEPGFLILPGGWAMVERAIRLAYEEETKSISPGVVSDEELLEPLLIGLPEEEQQRQRQILKNIKERERAKKKQFIRDQLAQLRACVQRDEYYASGYVPLFPSYYLTLVLLDAKEVIYGLSLRRQGDTLERALAERLGVQRGMSTFTVTLEVPVVDDVVTFDFAMVREAIAVSCNVPLSGEQMAQQALEPQRLATMGIRCYSDRLLSLSVIGRGLAENGRVNGAVLTGTFWKVRDEHRAFLPPRLSFSIRRQDHRHLPLLLPFWRPQEIEAAGALARRVYDALLSRYVGLSLANRAAEAEDCWPTVHDTLKKDIP